MTKYDSLSAALASITVDEMHASLDALLDYQDKKGAPALASDRLRIAAKYPAFGAVMRCDTKVTDVDWEEPAGLQFAAQWLATVAESRADTDLADKLIAVKTGDLMGIMRHYRSIPPARLTGEILMGLSQSYPLLIGLFGAARVIEDAEGAVAFIFLFGLSLVTVADMQLSETHPTGHRGA